MPSIPERAQPLGDAAAELYEMVSGKELTPGVRAVLDDILTVGPDGRWLRREYLAGGTNPVFVVRALAGLFLLDEDVLWIARSYTVLLAASRTVRTLIEGSEALSLKVRRIYLTNGDQRVVMPTGRQLRYVSGLSTARGLSVDCCLIDGVNAGIRAGVWPLLAARSNPQVVCTL